jgi:hypothetical protein
MMHGQTQIKNILCFSYKEQPVNVNWIIIKQIHFEVGGLVKHGDSCTLLYIMHKFCVSNKVFLGLLASENLPLVSSFENLAVTHL